MIRVKVLQDPQVKVETNAHVTVSDGGYERGYTDGYTKGNEDGLHKGYADGREFGYNVGYGIGKQDGYNEGLSARTYETWTITLTDGSIVEKEVALL